jgi:hypothetical protein
MEGKGRRGDRASAGSERTEPWGRERHSWAKPRGRYRRDQPVRDLSERIPNENGLRKAALPISDPDEEHAIRESRI